MGATQRRARSTNCVTVVATRRSATSACMSLWKCRDLATEGMWLTWCTPQNIIAACRKVGFLGDCLDPSQIDRRKFVDRHAQVEQCVSAAGGEVCERSDEPEEMDEVVHRPEGMRSGSVEALKAKLQLAMAYGEKLRHAVLAPLDHNSVPGLMEPRIAPVKKRVCDGSHTKMSEGGSATMRALHEKHQERRAEKAAEEVRRARYYFRQAPVSLVLIMVARMQRMRRRQLKPNEMPLQHGSSRRPTKRPRCKRPMTSVGAAVSAARIHAQWQIRCSVPFVTISSVASAARWHV
eukprot:6197366-Pleurochrysis_carterae.AAC.1